MSGNVWEWVSDLSGTNRVVRGGSWFNTANLETTIFSTSNAPGVKASILGFRLAK
jgi:formylglycine-generating enzyme required for sulfatase activity